MRPTSHAPRSFVQTTVTPASLWSSDSKIGPWRVVGELQQRPTGIAYAVSHSDTRQLAVLEVVHAPALSFGSYTERLRSLMHAVNRVDHPGALEIFDVGTLPDGRPYAVHELYDGVTLRARLAEGGMPGVYGMRVLLDICEVLAAAHAVGVAHGSLELGHVVLINRDCDPLRPRIKLIDWGIADAIADQARRPTLLGSRDAYVTSHHDPADDIYALGVIAHEILAHIPPGLESLWLAMMSDDRRARPSIAEVAKQLAGPGAAPAARSGQHAIVHEIACEVSAQLTKPRRAAKGTVEPALVAPTPPSSPSMIELDAAPAVGSRLGWRLSVAALACVAPVLYFVLATHDVRPKPHRVRAKPPIVHVAASSLPAVRVAVVEPPPPVEPSTPPPAQRKAIAKRPPPDDGRAALIAQYQRVGRDLAKLEHQHGGDAVPEISTRYGWIKIDVAMATPTSRKLAAASLRDLQTQITARLER